MHHHYTTDVVTTLKMSMPTITPPLHHRCGYHTEDEHAHHYTTDVVTTLKMSMRCGYHTEDEHAHHYTTDVVTTLKMSMLTITPPMWLPH